VKERVGKEDHRKGRDQKEEDRPEDGPVELVEVMNILEMQNPQD
jgi:hypothetical protein